MNKTFLTKNFCPDCNTELNWYTKDKISNKITELILKDFPLSYRPNDIYKIEELDEYQRIEYDYKQFYLIYKCNSCGREWQ